jgi:IPT/TIG domain
MNKSSIVAKVLPVAIVAAVLGASLMVRPVSINAVNTALCGFGYGYGYLQKPAVDSISPTIGPTAGGTVVTLTGCGFVGATAVKFGATNATTFTVDSDTQITATSPAHSAGTVDVSVTNAAGSSPSQAGDMFTYSNTCTSVGLSAAPPSGGASQGDQVVLTATGVCPHSGAQYEFWALWQGASTWQLLRGYSTINTYTWNSTGAPAPATEQFGVWVRDSSSSAAYDAYTSIPYAINKAECTSAGLTANPTSVTQGSGTHSTLTGTASGCSHSGPLFEFWAKWAGTTQWVIVRTYSTTATYDWNSTGALPGVETFGVWVKDANSTALYDAYTSATVQVIAATCSSVTLTPVPTTVVHGAGTHVILTAAASGCTNGTGQLYEFWMRTATTNWVIVQSYSTTATYNWNSTGAPIGTVYFGVWAKDKNSSNTYDAFASATVTVT